MFFANSSTLYVCDEGDGVFVSPPVNGNVENPTSLVTAGVQKWVLQNGTWVRIYVLQDGLNLGVPYGVPNYPPSLNPATGGCRNMTGRVNGDGTVNIWAITSTLSANGDQGADPNKLVKVTDLLSATTLPSGGGLGRFTTVRSAGAGEVLRGVAFAPEAPAFLEVESFVPGQMFHLDGFVHDVGGEITESVPGRVRMRIGGKGSISAYPRPGTLSWLGLGRRPIALNCELFLEHFGDGRESELLITVVFRAVTRDQAVDLSWRNVCNQIFCDLRAYLMGHTGSVHD